MAETPYRNPNDTRIDKTLLDRLSKLQDYKLPYGMQVAVRQMLLELEIYDASVAALNKNKEHILKEGLHIGCGSHYIEGYTNLDIFPGVADIVADAREGLPFDDETFLTIFSEHMLEHIDYPYSVHTVLAEMHRVLKTNGEIIIGVPDSEPVIRAYVEGDDDFMNYLKEEWYGRRPALHHYTQPIDLVHLVGADEFDSPKYAPHFWAYDKDKLTELLKQQGFTNITDWEFDEQLANVDRRWNSVYLKATK